MLIDTGRCIEFVEVAELKDSFLFVFNLGVEVESNLKARIKHLVFVRHKHKAQVVVAFVERNQFVEFFVAKGVTKQPYGVVASGSPWMGLAPMAGLGHDEFGIVSIHQDIHRTATYTTGKNCVGDMHEYIVRDDRFERSTFVAINILIQERLDALDGLFQAIRTRGFEATGDRRSFWTDFGVVKLNLVSEVFVVERRVVAV